MLGSFKKILTRLTPRHRSSSNITLIPELTATQISEMTKIPRRSNKSSLREEELNDYNAILLDSQQRYIHFEDSPDVRYFPLKKDNPAERLFIARSTITNTKYLTRVNLSFASEDEAMHQLNTKSAVRNALGDKFLTKQHHAYVVGMRVITNTQFLDNVKTLEDYIAAQPSPKQQINAVIKYSKQLYKFMATLSKRGVMWTDLKPANILVTPGGKIYVDDIKAMTVEGQPIYAANTTINFTAPDFLASSKAGRIPAELYQNQVRYMFGKTIESLLPENYAEYNKGPALQRFIYKLTHENPAERTPLRAAMRSMLRETSSTPRWNYLKSSTLPTMCYFAPPIKESQPAPTQQPAHTATMQA